MKACLKLATLAMVLIAPAGAYAADPVAGPIGSHQEAQQDPQQEPQRIPDPVEFFDKTTGKVKVWYWRAESGYEFYDAPGFHPRTGVALTAVTLDVITEWEQSQKTRRGATLSSATRARRSYTEITCLGWTQKQDASADWSRSV